MQINSSDSVSNKIQRVEELQVDPDESENGDKQPSEHPDEEVKAEKPESEQEMQPVEDNPDENLDNASKGGVIEGSVSSNGGFPDLNDSDGDQAPHELLSK